MSVRLETGRFRAISLHEFEDDPRLYTKVTQLFAEGYQYKWMGRKAFRDQNLPNTDTVVTINRGEDLLAAATLNERRITAVSAMQGNGVFLLSEIAGLFPYDTPPWITVDINARPMINTVMSKRLSSKIVVDSMETELLYANLKGVDINAREHKVTTFVRGGLDILPLNQGWVAHHRLVAELHPSPNYIQYCFLVHP